MLGESFYHLFKDCGTVCATDITLNEPWLEHLDVRNLSQYAGKASSFKPDLIIHLAANTNYEYCEINSHEAYITNTLSVENAVTAAKETGAALLYVSTSSIFDGQRDFYHDWDPPNPPSVYGRSKYKAETIVQNNMDRYFICRAGWMMGGGPAKDKKFVNKVIRQVEDGATEIRAVDDKLGCPTYTRDFALNAYKLVRTDFYGTYNMAGRGHCSRYQLAREIIGILNKKDSVNLIKVDYGYFRSTYFAERPASEVLFNTRLDKLGLNLMRHWREALEDYINACYSHLIERVNTSFP